MRTLKLTTIVALMLCVSACGFSNNQHRASRTDELTAPHVADQPVVVNTRNGSVDVVTDVSLGQVEVIAKLTCVGDTQEQAEQRLANSRVVVERDAEQALRISGEFDGAPRGGDGISVTVRVPNLDGVDVQTSNGSVTLVELAGRADVQTSNGKIRIESHTGEAKLVTSNGSIKVTDHAGAVDVHTSNGSVTADAVAGAFKGKSSNGKGTLSGITGPVTFHTSNGGVTVDLPATNPGPIVVESSNGSITATIREAFTGELDITTSNGWITFEDHKGRATVKNHEKNRFNVAFGDGEGRSKLHTSNAGVTVRVR